MFARLCIVLFGLVIMQRIADLHARVEEFRLIRHKTTVTFTPKNLGFIHSKTWTTRDDPTSIALPQNGHYNRPIFVGFVGNTLYLRLQPIVNVADSPRGSQRIQSLVINIIFENPIVQVSVRFCYFLFLFWSKYLPQHVVPKSLDVISPVG